MDSGLPTDSDDADARIERGVVLARERRFGETIASFRQAIDLGPQFHKCITIMASLWQNPAN